MTRSSFPRRSFLAATGALPIIVLATSGPLQAMLTFAAWVLIASILRRVGVLDPAAVRGASEQLHVLRVEVDGRY